MNVAELFNANLQLIQHINTLIAYNEQLKAKAPKEEVPKRHRKLAKEVVRSYKCPRCPKAYGAENSMRLHLKRKHGKQSKLEKKSDSSI